MTNFLDMQLFLLTKRKGKRIVSYKTIYYATVCYSTNFIRQPMTIQQERGVGCQIKQTASMLHVAFNNLLKPYSIAGEQFILMRLVNETPEISQKEIADFLVKDKTTVTKMLYVLEKKELITKERHKEDRRAYNITITQKGRDLIEEVAQVLNPHVEAFNAQFSEEEIKVFSTVINKCQEFIRKDLS